MENLSTIFFLLFHISYFIFSSSCVFLRFLVFILDSVKAYQTKYGVQQRRIVTRQLMPAPSTAVLHGALFTSTESFQEKHRVREQRLVAGLEYAKT